MCSATNQNTKDKGRTTAYRYNKAGQLIKTTDPTGQTSQIKYNAAAQPTALIDHRKNRLELQYDKKGRLIKTTLKDTKGNTWLAATSVFDRHDHLTASTNALGEKTAYQYDAAGQLQQLIDANGHQTTLQYDVFGRVKTILDDQGTPTAFQYDLGDNLDTVTDPIQIKTRYRNDDFAQKLIEDSQDRGQTQYAYDILNRPTRITYGGTLKDKKPVKHPQRDGTIIERLDLSTGNIGYKTANRKDAMEFIYGKADEKITGNRNRLIQIKETHHQIDYRYSPYGELTKYTQTMGTTDNNDDPSDNNQATTQTQAWQYNAKGQLRRTTLPNGEQIHYTYADNGDLKDIHLQMANQKQPLLTNIQYHPTGGIEKAQWGNGLKYAMQYDQAGRTTSQQRGKDVITYHYDKVGNITKQGTQEYQYDYLDRLIGATKVPLNEKLKQGSIKYQYDENGNRRQVKRGETTVTYTKQEGSNRLAGVTTDQCHSGHNT